MAIYKHSDGTINTIAPEKNIEGDYWNYAKVDEVLEQIDRADTWDIIDDDTYTQLCEELGLNYEDYDDPDKLFNDMAKKSGYIPIAERKEEIEY